MPDWRQHLPSTSFESSNVHKEKNERFFVLQIRLDFDTFTISGPSTVSTSVAKRLPRSGILNNMPVATTAPAPLISVAEMTNCLTDTFSVTNPGGPSPPTICGVNSGEHSKLKSMMHVGLFSMMLSPYFFILLKTVYVESSDCCNSLTFKLGSMGVGTSIASRSWSIKAGLLF